MGGPRRRRDAAGRRAGRAETPPPAAEGWRARGRGPPARAWAMATARPMAARRALRGRRAAEWVGRRQQLTAGREALIAPYPRTPAQPAPQGTDRAPLPPAQSTALRERSEPGGWGERAHARGRGEGGRARGNGTFAGGPYTAVGGAFPSPFAADRRRQNQIGSGSSSSYQRAARLARRASFSASWRARSVMRSSRVKISASTYRRRMAMR